MSGPYAPRPRDASERIGDVELGQALSTLGVNGGWRRLPDAAAGRGGTARRAAVEWNGDPYLLKQVPWYCDQRPHADGVVSVQDRLGTFTDLVPQLRVAPTGSALGAVPAPGGGERLYTLQQIRPGTPWQPTPRDCAAAGHALARLHVLLRDEHVIGAAAAVERRGAFATSRSALDRLTEHLSSDLPSMAGRRRSAGLIDRMITHVRRAEVEAGRRGYHGLLALVHGDLNPGNLLYDDSRAVTAVVDWDNCTWDHPAHDVARAVVHMGWLLADGLADRFPSTPSRARPDLARAFLDAYRRDSPSWPAVRLVLDAFAATVSIELIALGCLAGWFGLPSAQLWIGEIPNIRAAVGSG